MLKCLCKYKFHTVWIGSMAFAVGYKTYSSFKKRNQRKSNSTMLFNTLFDKSQETSQEYIKKVLPSMESKLQSIFPDNLQEVGKVKTAEEKKLFMKKLSIKYFSHFTSSIYAVVLLHLLLHCEITLIGRYTVLDQLKSRTKSTYLVSKSLEERFLVSSVNYFINQGLPLLAERVQKAIHNVPEVPLSTEVTQPLLKQYLTNIHNAFINFDVPADDFEDLLLATDDINRDIQAYSITLEDDRLKLLLNEMKEIIGRSDFSQMVNLCFNEISDRIIPTLIASPSSSLPLPKLLPLMKKSLYLTELPFTLSEETISNALTPFFRDIYDGHLLEKDLEPYQDEEGTSLFSRGMELYKIFGQLGAWPQQQQQQQQGPAGRGGGAGRGGNEDGDATEELQNFFQQLNRPHNKSP